ncbi:MAG: 3-oxoacyl-[acyl-carrier-protein] reductase [candidate division WOR-3 bacterium]
MDKIKPAVDRLKDKVAIITGGGSGIGAGVARLFAEEGALIAVCDIIFETAQQVCNAIGEKASPYKVDVSNSQEVDETVKKIIEKFGRIDILINNAGITKDGLLVRMSDQDWEKVLRINLFGTFYFTRSVVRYMMKVRYGRIVNISSIIGLMGNAGQVNYASSKAGVIAFTRSCAKELAGRNILVNAIAPGFIETPMTQNLSPEVKASYLKMIPLGRFGTPEDIARVALFLVSDEASYITGQVLTVDGGIVMA